MTARTPKPSVECPHCGEVLERGQSYAWPPEMRPHASLAQCVAYLRQGLEDVRQRLDAHNL